VIEYRAKHECWLEKVTYYYMDIIIFWFEHGSHFDHLDLFIQLLSNIDDHTLSNTFVIYIYIYHADPIQFTNTIEGPAKREHENLDSTSHNPEHRDRPYFLCRIFHDVNNCVYVTTSASESCNEVVENR